MIQSAINGEGSVVSENATVSIKKLIEYLYNLRMSYKELTVSSTCYHLSELASQLGVLFYTLILEVHSEIFSIISFFVEYGIL